MDVTDMLIGFLGTVCTALSVVYWQHVSALNARIKDQDQRLKDKDAYIASQQQSIYGHLADLRVLEKENETLKNGGHDA